MKVRITPGRAIGTIRVPTSKSIAHRMLICAALAKGESVIAGVGTCEDVCATLDCLKRLGAECRVDGSTVIVRGGLLEDAPCEPLPCRESGSTLRFLIPIALTSDYPVTFVGEGRLPERPQTVYESICAAQGLTFSQCGNALHVKGPLRADAYTVAGNVSSQFVTGLLLALPCLQLSSRLSLIPPVESRPYIDLTLDTMARFGVRAMWMDDCTLEIPGNQTFLPCRTEVEGDWSSGAFWEALGRLGSNCVSISNLSQASRQGDRVCVAYLDALQAGHATLSLADCPDLGPILFAYAGLTHGGTFTNTARLRMKESDRIATMRQELAKCGIEVCESEDTVTVSPNEPHAPTEPFEGHNDHRVVMALAIVSACLGGEICGAEAVAKSYPAFFEDLASLGIRIETEQE